MSGGCTIYVIRYRHGLDLGSENFCGFSLLRECFSHSESTDQRLPLTVELEVSELRHLILMSQMLRL